jgi:hypothetical protein
MKARFSATPVVLGLALCVLFPLFFIGGPEWTSGLLHRSAWNLGHLLFFGLVVFTWQAVFGVGGRRQWLLLSAGVFLVGGIIELLQDGLGREADWQDVFRNMLGAWLVMIWRQPSRSVVQWLPAAGLWSLRALLTTLLVFQIVPVAEVGFQQYQIARQLPVVFELYNPDAVPVAMTLRINDAVHERSGNAFNDRFNTRLVVEPGWNNYRIDLSKVESALAARQMNMEDLKRLGFFASGLEAPRSVFLRDLRLSRATSEIR